MCDRAREMYFNGTATAVSVKEGFNATCSDQELSLTFYLSIYSGKHRRRITSDAREVHRSCVQDVSAVCASALTAVAVVFGYARSLVIFHGLVRAAQTLHNSMFSAVLRTPVVFFDVNPIGETLYALLPEKWGEEKKPMQHRSQCFVHIVSA